MGRTLFEQAYNFWNMFIDIAVTMFIQSPTTANGGNLYNVAHNAYMAIQAISIPLATLCCMFAIIKDIISTPTNQQAKKLLIDLTKLGVLVAVLMNLWTFIGYIFQITDGLTNAISITGNYHLQMDPGLESLIDNVNNLENPINIDPWPPSEFGRTLNQWVVEELKILGTKGLLAGGGIATLVINIGAGLTILSASYQRIIKPLVIIPFGAISMALAAGTHEAEQTSRGFVKGLFGICISGAFMILCIKLGIELINTASVGFAFNLNSFDTYGKIVYYSAINCVTPLVIAGLVKGVDQLIAKAGF